MLDEQIVDVVDGAPGREPVKDLMNQFGVTRELAQCLVDRRGSSSSRRFEHSKQADAGGDPGWFVIGD